MWKIIRTNGEKGAWILVTPSVGFFSLEFFFHGMGGGWEQKTHKLQQLFSISKK
jgi:hypothetical protein